MTDIIASVAGLPGVAELLARIVAHRTATPGQDRQQRLLLDSLGVAQLQVLRFVLAERPDVEGFARWLVATAGAPDPLLLDRYRAWCTGEASAAAAIAVLAAIDAMPPVLDAQALACWQQDGFVVLNDAITTDECAAAAALVWAEAKADPADSATWYVNAGEGIWLNIWQHPAMAPARHSARVHKAFAQLFGHSNLWTVIDRIGFNPPETARYRLRASPLHWDISLAPPIPFAVQALLYLEDTPATRGAFRLVPGFHHRLSDWLAGLGDRDPRAEPLDDQAVPVPGRAGDLVIWRSDLPHGASPNRSDRPRLVQYLTMYPPDLQFNSHWR